LITVTILVQNRPEKRRASYYKTSPCK